MPRLESMPSSLPERVLECLHILELLAKDLRDCSTQEVWDQILSTQSDFYLAEDLRFFFNLPSWQRAETVLDMGCGQGDVLSTLARFFPAKRYTGVDLSESHIEVAKSRSPGRHVRFIHADAQTFEDGVYDVVMARCVLQHLADPAAFVEALTKRLSPAGVLILADADDAALLFQPEIPELQILYREARGTMKRNEIMRLEKAAAEQGLYVLSSDRTASCFCRERERIQFARYYVCVGVMLARRGLAIDFDKLLYDLANWAVRDHAYAQIGMHRLALGRERRKADR